MLSEITKEALDHILSEPDSIYKCNIHKFITLDIKEWFDHKFSIPHYEMGESICMHCNRHVKFDPSDELIQTNLEYSVPAICNYCSQMLGSIKSNCRVKEEVKE